MRNIIIFCLLATCYSCNALLFTKVGPLAYFKENDFDLPDTVTVFSPFYIYDFSSDILVNRPTWVSQPYQIKDSLQAMKNGFFHNDQMFEFERTWDSIWEVSTTKWFNSIVKREMKRTHTSNNFAFPFKHFSTKPERMSIWSPPTEALIGLAAWSIKGKNNPEALTFLPAGIKEESYIRPVVVASFFSNHYTVDYMGPYGKGYRNAKDQMSAIAMVFIIKNGEIQYYKNVLSIVGYKNNSKRTATLSKITERLFE